MDDDSERQLQPTPGEPFVASKELKWSFEYHGGAPQAFHDQINQAVEQTVNLLWWMTTHPDEDMDYEYLMVDVPKGEG
jgi:hypothetical protein